MHTACFLVEPLEPKKNMPFSKVKEIMGKAEVVEKLAPQMQWKAPTWGRFVGTPKKTRQK